MSIPTYSAIADTEIDNNSPITTTLMSKIRNNLLSAFSCDTSATSITQGISAGAVLEANGTGAVQWNRYKISTDTTLNTITGNNRLYSSSNIAATEGTGYLVGKYNNRKQQFLTCDIECEVDTGVVFGNRTRNYFKLKISDGVYDTNTSNWSFTVRVLPLEEFAIGSSNLHYRFPTSVKTTDNSYFDIGHALISGYVRSQIEMKLYLSGNDAYVKFRAKLDTGGSYTYQLVRIDVHDITVNYLEAI